MKGVDFIIMGAKAGPRRYTPTPTILQPLNRLAVERLSLFALTEAKALRSLSPNQDSSLGTLGDEDSLPSPSGALNAGFLLSRGDRVLLRLGVLLGVPAFPSAWAPSS